MTDVKTYWTFNPAYTEIEKGAAGIHLHPRRVGLDCRKLLGLGRTPGTPSTREKHRRTQRRTSSSLSLHGKQVYSRYCLRLMRTLGAECWIRLGPQNFVEDTYAKYWSQWEQWNLREGHTAISLRDIS
jgi:hypothetical protein